MFVDVLVITTITKWHNQTYIQLIKCIVSKHFIVVTLRVCFKILFSVFLRDYLLSLEVQHHDRKLHRISVTHYFADSCLIWKDNGHEWTDTDAFYVLAVCSADDRNSYYFPLLALPFFPVACSKNSTGIHLILFIFKRRIDNLDPKWRTPNTLPPQRKVCFITLIHFHSENLYLKHGTS